MTRSEYNTCVDDYSDAIYRFVLKNLNDEDDSADIVQEAFTRLWEKVKTVNYEKVKSYLFTSAYHIMIDFIRKRKKIVPEKDAGENFIENNYGFSDAGMNVDLKSILDEALSRLPSVQRSVILLRDYEGYSYQEIGDVIELTESQVKVYIYRARLTLQKYLKNIDLVI